MNVRIEEEYVKKKSDEEGTSGGKFPQVISFKCGETGHFSNACNKPKVCFICHSKEHIAEGCPEWKKPQLAARFYGSANKAWDSTILMWLQGLVDSNTGQVLITLGVFTVEEGELCEEEIVMTLKNQIDKEWNWKLMRMDEFRYLVKFPPHIKVESKVLGKATFFYLKNDEVMASLRVWNGDIEPVG